MNGREARESGLWPRGRLRPIPALREAGIQEASSTLSVASAKKDIRPRSEELFFLRRAGEDKTVHRHLVVGAI
jgi:hypothetical protein